MSPRPQGFALLIVLWMLVPLSILFLTLTSVARSDARLTFNLRDAATLTATADAGIETAIATLLQPGRSTAPLRLTLTAATVTVRIESLSGLLNPNIAGPELLRAVLIQVGAEPARADRIAAAILEWRAPSQQQANKAADYRAAGRDYGPPGEPFETLGELRLVLGMTPALYDAFAPLLTLDTTRPPEAALAPPPIRTALNDLGLRAGPQQTQSDVFRITADATNKSGAHALRQATIRIVPADRSRPWKILSRDSN